MGGLTKKQWLWIGVSTAAAVIIAVACVLVFVVFHVGSSGSGSSPEKTVQAMLDALSAKDADAFIALLDPQQVQQEQTAGMSVAELKSNIADQFTYDSMTFSGVKMKTEMGADGKTATVTITEGKVTMVSGTLRGVQDVNEGRQPQAYKVVLVDGKWYLELFSMQ